MNNEVPIRPAATIALLRDGARGPQVFMLRRSARQVFAARAYVYPGGRVEAADRHAELLARHDANAAAAVADALGVNEALGYWNAAVRECFEEAGVLVGCSMGSRQAPIALPALRERLNAGALGWVDVVRQLDLRFDASALHYFAFWTTPPGMPRRFSTRFFMARMPDDQQAVADGAETTRGEWLRPAAALERHAHGDIELMRPTVATLQQLECYTHAAAAMADAAARPVVAHP